MQMGTILVVGIENKQFQKGLEERQYAVITVDSIESVLDVEEKFEFMLIRDTLLTDIEQCDFENLYFSNNSTSCAILCKNFNSFSKSLLKILKNGTLDIFYDAEIKNGVIYHKIDKSIINAKLNQNFVHMQQESNKKNKLEEELNFRNQILDHEQGVNANILASIKSGLIIFDVKGTIILTNEQAKKLLYNSEADIFGSFYKESLPDEFCEIIKRTINEQSDKNFPGIIKKIKIDDKVFDIYCYHMLNFQRKPNGILLLFNDITEQENMNILLYRSEKLATVGTMLSGIAHELRNPLSIISARIERVIAKNSYDPSWLDKIFSSIQTQTIRCSSIVSNLLDFTRNTATNTGYHKLMDIIDETLTYIDYQNIFNDIIVQKHYIDDLRVFGDRSRFVQIFLNLISNAADAMDGKGTLTIATQQSSVNTTLVEINDTGYGIETESKNKIFDPFYTTKDPGKGTGLGLSIVYKIVQESNGKIWLTSKSGDTSFFVELPSERER